MSGRLCSRFLFFKQKTAYEMRISDWSSDVCSSDLIDVGIDAQHVGRGHVLARRDFGNRDALGLMLDVELADAAVEPLRQLGARLADARKDDVFRRHARRERALDRQSVVQGKSVSVRVAPGGRRNIK